MVLRAAAGATLLLQGIVCLSWHAHASATLFGGGVLLVLTSILILIGFLTPIASPLAASECLGMAFFLAPVPWALFDSRLGFLLAIAMFAAIAFLGPGAFSLDARLFGWKEIVIPAAPHKPEE